MLSILSFYSIPLCVYLSLSLSLFKSSSSHHSFLLYRVDYEFSERLKQYLNGPVSNDIENMNSAAPDLTHLKQLFCKEAEKTHK